MAKVSYKNTLFAVQNNHDVGAFFVSPSVLITQKETRAPERKSKHRVIHLTFIMNLLISLCTHNLIPLAMH